MSRRWIRGVLFAGLLGVLAVLLRGKARTRRTGWPVNLAHRGDSSRAPENTLEAFRKGIESGAGGLELDVHMTRDGQVVVIHDDSVNRTTDGSGAVRTITLEDLRALDAGYRFGGPSYPYRDRKLKVPTLAEVFREFPDPVVNIEIKEAQPGFEAAVLRNIEEAGAEDRTLVASAIHEVIRRFRRISGGQISTAASRREIVIFYLLSRLRLEGLVRPAYDALQVPVSHEGTTVVTPRFVEAAHARGVRLDVWTVDDPAEMRRLLDLGADAVMTNRPGTLSEVLEERG